MKIQKYLLLILFAIILLVSVNAIDIDLINCDQILQCDAYGVGWDGSANLDCNNAIQNSPDTEEVIVTDVRTSDYCESGDTASDCIDVALNYYEELNDNNIYHGNGFDRFGATTICCDFGDTTVYSLGFINDFNTDRENPISREWSILDLNDVVKDACPTITYNPVDITQTTDQSTFNISFKPFAHNYDQWVEPNFDQASMWSIQDFFLQNASDNHTYADQMKEWVQIYDSPPTWDIYDIFSFTGSESSIEDVFQNKIEYIKDSCTTYDMNGCTDSSSTSFSCTANTGVNIKDDLEIFFNKFFEKYKVPLMMQLGHEWCYGSTLSSCFTGSNYWETAYGIDSTGSILTYQGMRQFTERTLSRIQSDWVRNSYDAFFVVCDNDADIRVGMSETDEKGVSTYDYDTILGNYDLIKNEVYHWTVFNDETDVVTTDSLFRFDWNNDGSWNLDWDDQIEIEGALATAIDTSSITSQLTLDAETWGKGGTDSALTKYRIYNTPAIVFDDDSGESAPLGTSIRLTPFDGLFYDIGNIDWYCYDEENDGVYDYVFRTSSFTSYNCTTDGSTVVTTDSNLYNNQIVLINNIAGSYTLSLKGGINLVNSANYTNTDLISYEFLTPDVTAELTLKSSSWDTFHGNTIYYNLENSFVDNEIIAVCYDEDFTNSTYDYCFSVDGTGYCGLSTCTTDSEPELLMRNLNYADVNDFDLHQIRARVIETYNISDEDVQIYSFSEPSISPTINFISDSIDVSKSTNITLNAIGSTSENNISTICYDMDNDGLNIVCKGSLSDTFTIEYSNVTDYAVHQLKLNITDDQGYSDIVIESFSFRDLFNTAEIRKVSSSVDLGIYINETGWTTFDSALSNVEEVHHVCYDYTNNGTYEKCYSVDVGDTQCGISCDLTPIPLSTTVNLSYSVINEYGTFNLKVLVDNDNTISYDTILYGIFLDSPEKWYLPKITSSNRDDDVNDDFIIDAKDQVTLTEDIPEGKIWEFEFLSVESDYLYDPNFACWGNSITGVLEECYMLGGGYNTYCDMNCTNVNWFTPYTINSSLPYDKNSGYGVTLILGSTTRAVAGYTTEEFKFNPVVQQDVDNIKVMIILTVFIVILAILLIVFLLAIGLFTPTLIFRTLFLDLLGKKKINKAILYVAKKRLKYEKEKKDEKNND